MWLVTLATVVCTLAVSHAEYQPLTSDAGSRLDLLERVLDFLEQKDESAAAKRETYQTLTSEEVSSFYSASVTDSGGTVSLTASGDGYVIRSNGLPDHQWQCVNPNEPASQNYQYTLPVPTYPFTDDVVYALPAGDIGIAVNGVPFFNALGGPTSNAVEGTNREDFDSCGGHATRTGNYHYHTLKNDECNGRPIYDVESAESQFIGVALDGFPIYSAGVDINLDELDICHGTELDGRYVYIASSIHFPYFMGCFRGRPANELTQIVQCPSGGGPGQLCSCWDATTWLTREDTTTDCDGCYGTTGGTPSSQTSSQQLSFHDPSDTSYDSSTGLCNFTPPGIDDANQVGGTGPPTCDNGQNPVCSDGSPPPMQTGITTPSCSDGQRPSCSDDSQPSLPDTDTNMTPLPTLPPTEAPSTGTDQGPSTGSGSGQGPSTGSGSGQGPPTGSGSDQGPSTGSGSDQGPSTGSGSGQGPPTGSGSGQGPPTGSGTGQGSPTGTGQDTPTGTGQGPPTGSGSGQGPPTGGSGGNGRPQGQGGNRRPQGQGGNRRQRAQSRRRNLSEKLAKLFEWE